jgi:hypothetical protein
MLEALKVQKEYSELGTGLLRLTLHHNAPTGRLLKPMQWVRIPSKRSHK